MQAPAAAAHACARTYAPARARQYPREFWASREAWGDGQPGMRGVPEGASRGLGPGRRRGAAARHGLTASRPCSARARPVVIRLAPRVWVPGPPRRPPRLRRAGPGGERGVSAELAKVRLLKNCGWPGVISRPGRARSQSSSSAAAGARSVYWRPWPVSPSDRVGVGRRLVVARERRPGVVLVPPIARSPAASLACRQPMGG
jgi:hypothetical protein